MGRVLSESHWNGYSVQKVSGFLGVKFERATFFTGDAKKKVVDKRISEFS